MAKYDISKLTIAITGSTGGLGSALAKTLHAKGAKLALLDLDGERAPGVFRKAVEVLGFRDSEIEKAVTAAGRR